MGKEKVLIVSVHPDDETLGCGGTILKHKSMGDKLYWSILTDVHVEHGWSEELILKKSREAEKVIKKYGFIKTFTFSYPAARLETVSIGEIVKNFSKIVREVQPSIIYIFNRSDIHSDHRHAFQAIISCTKNFRYPHIKKILMYETLSETEFAPALTENSFIPNVFVDITDYMEKKLEIMKIYKSEIMPAPLPRSLETIEALARYRGSRIGVKYAEAFMLLQEIM